MESEGTKLRNNGEKLVAEKFIVNYKSHAYDLTEFIFKHPGGVNTLSGKNHKSIDSSFHSVEHSKAAKYLMNEYKIIDSKRNDLDESMEHLVDWNSAMMPQISRLGEKYIEWVNLPVDRNLRLFNNNFLEKLSKTPWYFPLLIWIPFIIFCIITEISSLNESVNVSFTIVVHLLSGILIWSALEYNLHRYLFHIDVRRHPQFATFHFLIHGLHHKVPFDAYRLVFPPVPAALIAAILYQPILILNYLEIVAYPRLLLAGGFLGYIFYDMTHFYIHHGNPSSDSYFYYLKRYHHYHHFVNFNQGFGISNNMWDRFHGTEIFLRKLKYALKWRF